MEKGKTLECYKLSDKFMYYLSDSRVCALHQNTCKFDDVTVISQCIVVTHTQPISENVLILV